MFDHEIVLRLGKDHERVLLEIAQIEKELNERFVNFEMPARALVLSAISGEPLLLIGPPGTAKSRLIRAFSGMLGLLDEDHPERDHPGYFEYLLTPFTEPGELFGFFDIGILQKYGKLVRDDEGMMQYAAVVYLDEVFNASSAILNSLLAFLNERIFHDRGKRIKVQNLKALFAATNNVPQTPELRAVFDRFVLRCWVNNVEEKPTTVGHFKADISRLIRVGWKETYGSVIKADDDIRNYRENRLLIELGELRKVVNELTKANQLLPRAEQDMYSKMAELVKSARENGLSEMSNRRLVKMSYVHFLHHVYLYTTRTPPKDEELSLQWLVVHYFFDSSLPKDDPLSTKLLGP